MIEQLKNKRARNYARQILHNSTYMRYQIVKLIDSGSRKWWLPGREGKMLFKQANLSPEARHITPWGLNEVKVLLQRKRKMTPGKAINSVRYRGPGSGYLASPGMP